MEALSWEGLRDFITQRIPAVVPIVGVKGMALVVGRGATTLGLRIPCNQKDTPVPSPYRELTLEVREIEGTRVIELMTESPSLFRAFYVFALGIAELIESDAVEPLKAIRDSLDKFGELLVARTGMSQSSRLGLFGELCFLEALIKRDGPGVFGAWLGPLAERHDFRIGQLEFEIKSTRQSARRHLINGIAQLEPSPGKKLYILSFQFELAGTGSGLTLPDQISSVRHGLSSTPENVDALDGFLKGLGYQDEDALFYSDSLQLRSSPVLIPVDDACPKLASAEIRKALSENLVQRIGELHYEIDVEGLGFPEGSKEFAAILPRINFAR